LAKKPAAKKAQASAGSVVADPATAHISVIAISANLIPREVRQRTDMTTRCAHRDHLAEPRMI